MNIRANLNRLFKERTLRVGGDQSPKEPDLNRLFEECTLRVSGDRSPKGVGIGFKPQPWRPKPEGTGFKPQPWRPKPEGRRE